MSPRMTKAFLAGLITFSLSSASSGFVIPGISDTSVKISMPHDPDLAKTGLYFNEEDITSDQNIHALTLTESQLHEAKVWGLTEEEEKRYVLLMQNRSAIYYEGLRLTPIDILGINARDEAERNHFAELGALQEAQKVSKNIAWNNAFYKAYNQLFQRIPVIGDFDPSPYSPYAHQPMQLVAGEVLYLFITPETPIKNVLMTLIDGINQIPMVTLHIMMLNANDTDIRLWANQHHIPHSLVVSSRISLNHGEQQYEALEIAKKSTPLLLLVKDGVSRIVDLGRF